VRTSRVAFEKAGGHQILRPSFSVVGSSKPFGSLVGDENLELVWQRYCFRQAVRHAFEHARVPDLIYCVAVFSQDCVVLVNERESAPCPSL